MKTILTLRDLAKMLAPKFVRDGGDELELHVEGGPTLVFNKTKQAFEKKQEMHDPRRAAN